MAKELKLISPIPPSVNHYLSYRAIKTREGRVMATSYKTKEAKQYQGMFKDYVKEQVEKQRWDINEFKGTHLYVDTIFYFPRRDMDCNNYFKVLLDAITDTKVVWEDDNIVCERVGRIMYDNQNPRIELVITPVSYVGIFDNDDKLRIYEERCKGCKRYSKNCVLLNRAKSGYIQEGITQEGCGYFKELKKPQIKISDEQRSENGKEKE